MPCSNEEIDHIVRQYESEYSQNAVVMIDDCIDKAKADFDWDEMTKWHRVRLRIQRQRVVHDAVEQSVHSLAALRDHDTTRAWGR